LRNKDELRRARLAFVRHDHARVREVFFPRVAPVTPHMVLDFVAEKALRLPRSY
jgi:hypothetical protein